MESLPRRKDAIHNTRHHGCKECDIILVERYCSISGNHSTFSFSPLSYEEYMADIEPETIMFLSSYEEVIKRLENSRT